MSLLISLLILLVIGSLVVWVVTLLPLPAPVRQVVIAVMAVVLLIVALQMVAGVRPWFSVR